MFFIFFLIIILFIFLCAVLLGFIIFFRYRSRGLLARALNMTLFMIKVPREKPKENIDRSKQEKEQIAISEQLFTSLANMKTKGWQNFFFGNPYVSLEIAVDHIAEDIHFYIAVPRLYETVAEKQIHGLYPTVEVLKVKDYNIFNPGGAVAGSYFVITRHPLLTFRTYQKLEADPLGEILTSFSKLAEEGEGASIQMILRPSQNRRLKKLAAKVSREIQKGYDFGEALSRARKNEILHFFGNALVELISPSQAEKPEEKKMKQEERKAATAYHEELMKSMVGKFSKVVFDANIRILASASTEVRASQIIQEIEGAFAQFAAPDLNSLKSVRTSGSVLKKLVFDFSFRLFRKNMALYLSTEEVASIYHFPIPTTAAPRVHMLKAKPAEPPTDLPKEGIILGKNTYRGEDRFIRMTRDDRRRHLYVIGQTGTGKTTFLKGVIIQDIAAGEGVCVVDPHGDLIEDILNNIPRDRANDVIVFNPGDISRPLGLNILEIDPDQPQQKSFVIDDFYKILRTIYKDLPEAFGPIFEKFFKNTIMLLLDDYKNEIPTIAEISRVFADKEYRDLKLSRETNPEIIRFWRFEAEKMSGEWALPNMSGYITSKFAPFILNEYVRPIITQQKSSFNFREVMDSKKILLVNLSKGLIGEINASLLGMIVVSKLLIAAFSRVDIPQEERKDFYLYIDEFQNFTTDSIAVILSEARKYRLNLIIAHQFIKQLEEKIKNAVFGNVGSMVSFRIGAEDAEAMKARFEPTFSPNDLMNIDNFNAYVNLLIYNRTAKPFNIIVPQPPQGDREIARAIIELSRLQYGRDRQEVEQSFRERQGLAYGADSNE